MQCAIFLVACLLVAVSLQGPATLQVYNPASPTCNFTNGNGANTITNNCNYLAVTLDGSTTSFAITFAAGDYPAVQVNLQPSGNKAPITVATGGAVSLNALYINEAQSIAFNGPLSILVQASFGLNADGAVTLTDASLGLTSPAANSGLSVNAGSINLLRTQLNQFRTMALFATGQVVLTDVTGTIGSGTIISSLAVSLSNCSLVADPAIDLDGSAPLGQLYVEGALTVNNTNLRAGDLNFFGGNTVLDRSNFTTTATDLGFNGPAARTLSVRNTNFNTFRSIYLANGNISLTTTTFVATNNLTLFGASITSDASVTIAAALFDVVSLNHSSTFAGTYFNATQASGVSYFIALAGGLTLSDLKIDASAAVAFQGLSDIRLTNITVNAQGNVYLDYSTNLSVLNSNIVSLGSIISQFITALLTH